MDLLDLVREAGLDPGKRAASTKGGEYGCPCPKCGGSDRFRIWPNEQRKSCVGGYWCRKCGIKGDSIQFCREFLGLSWDEAVKKVGANVALKEKPFSFMPPKKTERFFSDVTCPPDRWLKSAENFVRSCHESLFNSPDAISILEKRGIPFGALPRYKLGFCQREAYQERESWGLEPEFTDAGKKKGIWLPRGIVIPVIDGGRVVRINIRRTDWKPEDEAGKYIKVSGGMKGLNIIGDTTRHVMLVVESELDAYALHVAASDFSFVIATSSYATNPDRVTDYFAKSKEHLLICHDNDDAGRAMLKKWQELYPHARAYPTPIGKDVGEFVQQGGGLREWVLEAFPKDFLTK